MRTAAEASGAVTRAALIAAVAAALFLAAGGAAADGATADAKPVVAPETPAPSWRRDPTVPRRPGSYIGGAVGYVQAHAWVPANDSHGDLEHGPIHTWGMGFRVGDAFAEWFAVGFQLQIASGKNDVSQISAFALLLDATFYPWRGLGLRPSVGLGFGYAQGEHEWEMGGGGPGCLAGAILYEFRILRLLTIAPVVQVSWIAGEEFDGLFFFAGLEITKWFATATG
jgi:hypothetical protein